MTIMVIGSGLYLWLVRRRKARRSSGGVAANSLLQPSR